MGGLRKKLAVSKRPIGYCNAEDGCVKGGPVSQFAPDPRPLVRLGVTSVQMTISQTNSQRLPDALAEPPDARGPIVRIDAQRRLEAVVRLLSASGESDTVRAERFIAFSQKNRVALDAMWSWLEPVTGRILHTVLAIPNAGRTAMLFASRPRREREVVEIADLIDHAVCAMGLDKVQLVQALLDPSELIERDAFLAGGFSELARLSYMERPLPTKRQKTNIHWPGEVAIESFREEMERDWLAVLEASYEETLDCPGLRGLRETRDILVGHKAAGEFDPALWTLLRIDGRPGGALLLNPSPSQRSIELVYLGLAKFARGRGFGKVLLHHGFNLLAGRSERTITLAVDERNDPALTLYKREGFRRVLRRVALIRRVSCGVLPAEAGAAHASA